MATATAGSASCIAPGKVACHRRCDGRTSPARSCSSTTPAPRSTSSMPRPARCTPASCSSQPSARRATPTPRRPGRRLDRRPHAGVRLPWRCLGDGDGERRAADCGHDWPGCELIVREPPSEVVDTLIEPGSPSGFRCHEPHVHIGKWHAGLWVGAVGGGCGIVPDLLGHPVLVNVQMPKL